MTVPMDPALDPNFPDLLAEPDQPTPKQFQEIPFGDFGADDVEFELIGSILRKGDIFEDVSGVLAIEMFRNTVCSDLFLSMQRVREHGLILDQVTVGDQLLRDGVLDSIKYGVFGGRAALTAIRDKGNLKNYPSYIEIIKDYWAKRKIDHLAQALVKQSRNGRRAVDILSDARTNLDALDVVNGNVSVHTYNARSSASLLYDHVDKAANGQIKGCITGFIDLDEIILMMGGDLLVLGGRPGQGKSTFLDSVAVNLLKDYGKRIGFFSLEMSAKQVNARFISHLSGIPSEKILKGKIEAREWPLFTHAIEHLESLPFMINDKAAITVPQFRVEVKRMIRELGALDLIELDYAQLMKAAGNHKNRYQEIGEITRGLKDVAREFDVPIMVAAQMSRAVEQRSDKRPVLSDLREGGDLEADADIVMFIHRPDQYSSDAGKQNVAEIIVAKHRNGPVGSVELVFRGALTKFENACSKVFRPNEPAWQNRADMGD